MTRSRIARISRTSLAVAAAFTTLLAAACDDDSGTTPDRPKTVATVGVLPAERTLVVGEEIDLTARPMDAEGRIVDGRTVTWSSTDETIARVTASGRVTAVGVGTATIRATVDGKIGSAQLVVTVAPVARIDVTPATLSMEEGETRTVVAVARDASGRELPDRSITWSTSDATIAEVDGSGHISAKRVGTVTVSAAAEGKNAAILVTVVRVAVASVVITPTALVLDVGETRQLTAITKDARGNELTGRVVTWTTDNANATVSANGLLTARQTGYVTITATCEGKTFGAAATIVPAEPYGYELVYQRSGAQNSVEIFILSLGDGSSPVRLNAGNVSSQPTAAPDGSRIAFTVSQVDLGTQQRIDDIFAVDRNGLNMKRLTTAAGTEDQPAWSPAGGHIAYRHIEANGRTDIWVMNTDGSGPMNLTADLPPGMNSAAPAWSPDGSRIAFATAQSGADGTTTGIWTMRADGSDKRQITSTLTGFDATPTWAPSGDRIAFIRYYAGDADIAIVSTAGGEPVRLALPGLQWTPAWSPDGRFIAYAEQSGALYNLYTVSPNGTRVRLRTVDPAWRGGFDPTWIPKP